MTVLVPRSSEGQTQAVSNSWNESCSGIGERQRAEEQTAAVAFAVGVTPGSAAAILKLMCRVAASNARSSMKGGSLFMT
jgi:hypothetical protein